MHERDDAAERVGRWWVAASVALAAILGLWRSGDPWEHGNRGMTGGAYFGPMAQNALRLGPGPSRGLPVLTVEPTDPPSLMTYANHPPLLPWIVSASAACFGATERVLRATALVLCLPALPALFALARRFLGPLGAGSACVLLAGAPMFGYYGPAVDFGCLVLSSGTFTALALVRYCERPDRRRWALLLAATAAGGLVDWPNYFVALVLPLLAWVAPARRASLARACWPWVAAAAALAVLAGYLAWALGGWGALHERLSGASRWRAPVGSVDGDAANALGGAAGALDGALGGALALPWREAWTRSAAHAATAFTWPILALAAVGIGVGACSGARGRAALAAGLVLAAPGILNVAVFPRHSLLQEYWLLPASCGVAFLAAIPAATAFGAREAGAAGRRAWAPLALAATLAASGWGVLDTCRRIEANRTTVYRDIGARLDTRFRRGDVVITDANVPSAIFYTDACLIWGVANRAWLERTLEQYRPPRVPAGRTYVVLTRVGRAAGLGDSLAAFGAPEEWSGLTVYALGR